MLDEFCNGFRLCILLLVRIDQLLGPLLVGLTLDQCNFEVLLFEVGFLTPSRLPSHRSLRGGSPTTRSLTS